MEQGVTQNRASTRSQSNRPPSCWTNLVVQNNALNPYSSQVQDVRAVSCSESAQNNEKLQQTTQQSSNRNQARPVQKSVTNKFETDHNNKINELTDIKEKDVGIKSVAQQKVIDVSSSEGSCSRQNDSNQSSENMFKRKSMRQSMADHQSPKNDLFPAKSARKQSQQQSRLPNMQLSGKRGVSERDSKIQMDDEMQQEKEAEGFSSGSSSSDASLQEYNKMSALNGELPTQKETPSASQNANLQLEPIPKKQGWKILDDMDSLPLMKSGYSLEADMKFGWRPSIKGKVLPIPLVFDVEDEYFALDQYLDIRQPKRGSYPTIYQGWRPSDSLKMHKRLLQNKHKIHGSEYPFKMPGELPSMVQKLLDQQMQERVGVNRNDDGDDRWSGMASSCQQRYESGEILQFDSAFECGNLDRVVMISPKEYDLYMRPDTNVRGHHQWFYFKVTSRRKLGTVKFNIVNFTKRRSLYETGMKICYCNVTDKEFLIQQAKDKGEAYDEEMIGWRKGCKNIKYESSKLNRIIQQSYQVNDDGVWVGGRDMFYMGPHFQQLSFTYDFNRLHKDETYFSYMFPYTFTRLTRFMKDLKNNEDIESFFKDCTPLCQSLSGVDVPYLQVSSRINDPDYMMIDPEEFPPDQQPFSKKKKIVIMTGRVHPGESNSSFMMEGFIKFILSPKNQVAAELRKRIVFKIIPCQNPDGVIIGNYRVSMSGNDLNRRYFSPHSKLHPVVCAVKKLFAGIKPNLQCQHENQILAYIDMHGHSRKKNVFMYGPQFPIHDARYLRMRVLPKLMSEEDEMFRFFSCKFRVQRSKEKTARVVIWRQFNVMNCFTLEASFHGFFNKKRETKDFMINHFSQVGKMLANSLHEYSIMKEEEIRHQREMRARREEMRLLKQKAMQINPVESISKIQPQPAKKNNDNSQILLEPPATHKSMLSPSASSEAIMNIDDLQPETNPQNKKINQLRKKLLKDQKSKKAADAKGESGAKAASTKEANKKKFKLTKKFKDEDRDLPPKPKKKVVNPNPNEAEEVDQEGDDSPYQAHRWSQVVDPADDDQLDLSDTLNAIPLDKPKSRYSQRNPKSPGVMSPKPKRNFADLFQEIQKDEALAAENDSEEGDSSGNNSAGPDSIKGDPDDPYGSDDETNNALLQRIGEKILNILNTDLKVDMRIQNAKAVPLKDKKKPQQKSKNAGANTSGNIVKGSQNISANNSQVQSEKRPNSNARYNLTSQQRQPNSASKDQRLIGLGFNRRSQVPQTGMGKKQLDEHGERPRPYSKQKGNSYQTAQVPLHSNKYGVQSGQHYQGILLQLTNNNFNERIMSQPTYNKHKKNNKFGHFQGISGIHHLHSLTTNAHQMLQKQLQKVHAPPSGAQTASFMQNPATAPANVGAINLSQQPPSKMSQLQVPGNKSSMNAQMPLNSASFGNQMSRMGGGIEVSLRQPNQVTSDFITSQRMQLDSSKPAFNVNTTIQNVAANYPLVAQGNSRQFASSNEVTEDRGLLAAEPSFHMQQRVPNTMKSTVGTHQKSIDLTNIPGPTTSNSLTNSQAVSASKIIDFSAQNMSNISDQRLSELAMDNCNFVTNKLKQQQRQINQRLQLQQKADGSVITIKKPMTSSNLHPHNKRINNLGFDQGHLSKAGGSTQMGFFAVQQQQTKEMTIYGNAQKGQQLQQSASKLNQQASKQNYDDFTFFNTQTRTPQLQKHYPIDKYPISSTEKERQSSNELPKQLQRASYMTQKSSQLNMIPQQAPQQQPNYLLVPPEVHNRREPGSASAVMSQGSQHAAASRGARFWQHQQRVLQSIQDKSATNSTKQ